MPRKPWVKLSTGIISSTTWKATVTKGFREFIALMVLADNEGNVDRINVEQLPMTVYFNSGARWEQKVDKVLTLLQQMGTILRNQDGSISLPKYKEYQYFVDKRPNSEYRITPTITPALPQRRAEQRQSRAETEKKTTLSDLKKPKSDWNPVAVFCELYKSYLHVNPDVDGKDAKLITAFGKRQGQPAFKAAVRAFLNDPWQPLAEQGYPAGQFYNRRNRYKAEAKAPPPEPLEEPVNGDEPGFDFQAEFGSNSTARSAD